MIGAQSSAYLPEGGWQLSFNYRFLHSFRHFVGTEEQKGAPEVENRLHLFDLGITYALNQRVSLSLGVPFQIAERHIPDVPEANVLESNTSARGLGDISFVPRAWILDPVENPDGNIGLGLGIKLPTGEPGETDTFSFRDPDTGEVTREVRTVDQSIQPGDGGWGFVLDLQAFRRFGHFIPFISGTYLLNPRNTNNVLTYRTQPGEEVMSVSDQYLGRVGVAVGNPWHPPLGFSLGARIEGVPVRDLIGDSDGFRRPGFAISIEPGISYVFERHSLTISVPVAVHRDRLRSLSDEDNDTHGDAAFADWVFLASYAIRLGPAAAPPPDPGPGPDHESP